MIEVEVFQAAYTKFYLYKIVKPFDYEHGVHIEYVGHRLQRQDEEKQMVRQLGLRYLREDETTLSSIYAVTLRGYIQYRFFQCFIDAYWKTLIFLYKNARMFKEIPQGNMFSWKYFTLYILVSNIFSYLSKKVKGRILKGFNIKVFEPLTGKTYAAKISEEMLTQTRIDEARKQGFDEGVKKMQEWTLFVIDNYKTMSEEEMLKKRKEMLGY